MEFADVAQRLLAVPTAPYREAWVRDEILAILGEMGLAWREDRWGNLAARVTRDGWEGPPLALVTHMDHPGFVVTGPAQSGRVPVTFEGGVAGPHFPGARVRLFTSPTDPGTAGTVVEISARSGEPERNRTGWVEPDAEVTGAVLGMWDLPASSRDGDTLEGRAIDDLAGVAAALVTLERVSHTAEPCDLIALFTRAEETGFRGLCALLRDGKSDLLPAGAESISIEMSSARPQTPIGEGAVLRVGDARTVFDNDLLQRIAEASRAVCDDDPERRPLRRALMDGGVCEASALVAFGHPTAGVCLPLGNYHNMDTEREVIAPERIALRDAEDLVATLTRLALTPSGTPPLAKLRGRLEGLAESARPHLEGFPPAR